MAVFTGTYFGYGYRNSDSTSSDAEWEPDTVIVYGASGSYTANTATFDASRATEAVREFEETAAEEEIPEPPDRPWLDTRPSRQPKRAFTRRPSSTRRRRRTEAARRQKAVRPP